MVRSINYARLYYNKHVREVPSAWKKTKAFGKDFLKDKDKDMYENLKETKIIHAVSKLTIFVNL